MRDEQPTPQLHAARTARAPTRARPRLHPEPQLLGPVADDLAADHEVVASTRRGTAVRRHHRRPPAGAELIADRRRRATYIGYSMGARFVLHVALARPERSSGGSCSSAPPPASTTRTTARARQRADERIAERLEREGSTRSSTPGSRSRCSPGSPRRCSSATQRARTRSRASRQPAPRRHRRAGPVVVAAARARHAGARVAGADDAKFSVRGGAPRRASIGPNATIALVPGAGHAAHLEQPDAFLAIVRPWLAAHGL